VDEHVGRATFGEEADRWLQAVAAGLERSTYRDYEGLLRVWLTPRFGRWALRDLGYEDIQGFVNELGGWDQRDGRFVPARAKLGAERIRRCCFVLQTILTEAVLRGRLARSPYVKVRRPRSGTAAGRVPKDDALARRRPGRGARPGDRAPLRGDDLRDGLGRPAVRRGGRAQAGELRVPRGGAAPGNGGPQARQGRGLRRHQEPPDPQRVASARRLRDPRAAPRHLHAAAGRGVGVHRSGRAAAVAQQLRQSAVGPALERADLDPELRPHDLRHTCASLLASEGWSMFEVKEQLGHSSITVTEKYTHFFPTHLAEKARRSNETVRAARKGQQRPKVVQLHGGSRTG
jgi:integrase